MNIEVAYASQTKQQIITLDVAPNTTVIEAIRLAKIQTVFPEIDLSNISVGIYSQKVSLDTTLNDGDRVEIYRPLLIDPMKKRRQRAS